MTMNLLTGRESLKAFLWRPRRGWILAILMGFRLLGNAGEPGAADLSQFGYQIQAKGASINWKTNPSLPGAMFVYKVVSRTFAASTISNLLVLGGLAESNRIRLADDGVFSDKDVSYYNNAQRKRILGFVPSQGLIVYNDSSISPRKVSDAAGMLDNKDIRRRALELLQEMGITETELALDPDTNEPRALMTVTEVIARDKKLNKLRKTTTAKGMVFTRGVQNIEVTSPFGNGNVYLQFGGSNQLIKLNIVWRELKPVRKVEVASIAEINESIRSGGAYVQSSSDGEIRRLTIFDVKPAYMEYPGNVRQKEVYPYLLIFAEAGWGGSSEPVVIAAPILSSKSQAQ